MMHQHYADGIPWYLPLPIWWKLNADNLPRAIIQMLENYVIIRNIPLESSNSVKCRQLLKPQIYTLLSVANDADADAHIEWLRMEQKAQFTVWVVCWQWPSVKRGPSSVQGTDAA
jgi:hypothetical protein